MYSISHKTLDNIEESIIKPFLEYYLSIPKENGSQNNLSYQNITPKANIDFLNFPEEFYNILDDIMNSNLKRILHEKSKKLEVSTQSSMKIVRNTITESNVVEVVVDADNKSENNENNFINEINNSKSISEDPEESEVSRSDLDDDIQLFIRPKIKKDPYNFLINDFENKEINDFKEFDGNFKKISGVDVKDAKDLKDAKPLGPVPENELISLNCNINLLNIKSRTH